MAEESQNTSPLQFEDIEPWQPAATPEGSPSGDTGLSSRLKLKRNFDRIKLWATQLASTIQNFVTHQDLDEFEEEINGHIAEVIDETCTGRFLSKTDEDTAAEQIGFLKGLWVNTKNLFGIAANGTAKVYSLLVNGPWGIGNNGDATLRDASLRNMTASGNVSVTDSLTAAQLIASLLKTPEFVEAVGMIGNGFGVTVDNNGKAKLQTNDLIVLGQMIVNSLNIREVTYIGGTYLLTPAGSTVAKVLPLYGSSASDTRTWSTSGSGTVRGYRLLWKADNGTVGTMNYWQQGDQAFCQTYNVTQTGNYNNANNQRYWRLVCRRGQVTIEGVVWHYADLSNNDVVYLYDDNGDAVYNASGGTAFVGYENASGSTPKADDKVICLGSQRDTTRQGAVQITAEGTTSFGIYDGINNYAQLSTHEIHYLAKESVRMNARRFSWTTGSGHSVPPTVYNGTWTQGKVSGWGDEWTYNGANWLCVISNGTTTEAPGTTEANWVKNQGPKGDPGDTIKTVTAYTTDIKQPSTPTGSTLPPTGWQMTPPADIRKFENATDANHHGWRVAKGYQTDNVFIVERLTIITGATATIAIDIEASSEASYDYIGVGNLDTALTSRSSITGLNSSRRTSGNSEKKTISLTVTAGTHFVDIAYSKDGSTSSYNDCAWYRFSAPSTVDVTIQQNRIWESVATMKNDVLQGAWSVPVERTPSIGMSGDDGHTLICTPGAVVLTQDMVTTTNFGLPQYVSFIGMRGNTPVDVSSLSSVSGDIVSASVHNTTQIQVTAVTDTAISHRTSSGEITATVTLADGFQTTVRIPVVVNYLGTFKTTIAGDVETSVAQKITYGYDNKTGAVGSLEALGKYIRSSEENISEIQATVSGHTSSISTIQQTSNEIKLEVRTMENLLYNREFLPPVGNTDNTFTPDGWGASGSTNVYADRRLGIFNSGYIISMLVSGSFVRQKIWDPQNSEFKRLRPEKIHTLSFWLRGSEVTDHARIVFYGSTFCSHIDDNIIVDGESVTLTAGTSQKYVDVPVKDTSGYIRHIIQFAVDNMENAGEGFLQIEDRAARRMFRIVMPSLVAGKVAGIDVKNGIVDIMADNFSVHNEDGEKTMGIDKDGNFMVSGTVRAKNFYHGICIWTPGGQNTGYTSDCWYCETAGSDYDFEPGKYYTAQQVFDISGGDYGQPPTQGSAAYDMFVACTGGADIVYMTSNNWSSTQADNGIVILPRPEDYEGKVVDVYMRSYGSNTGRKSRVGCINDHMITGILIANQDGTSSISSSNYTPTIDIEEQTQKRFISIRTSSLRCDWFELNETY